MPEKSKEEIKKIHAKQVTPCIMTTLCYIEKDDAYLMLHRTKKENDINHDKWIGVGGKFLDRESPEECLLREVKEETGLTLTSWKFRSIITFIQKDYPTEFMCLYTADAFRGEMAECDEGTLEWIPKSKLPELNLWDGDKIFLEKLQEDDRFFSMKLEYKGDTLVRCTYNGEEMNNEYCKFI